MHAWLKRLIIGACLLLVAPAWAEQQWVQVRKADSPEDVSVFTRYIAGAQLKAFKGITQTRAPFSKALALILDLQRMPDWFFRCENARILKITDAHHGIGYIVIGGIWPVKDRDVVTRGTLTQDPQTLAVTLDAVAAPDLLPRKKGYVRIPRMQARWTLTPEANGWTRIELEGHADPGGDIPLWLANSVVQWMPLFSLKNLHKQLAHPENIPSLDNLAGGFDHSWLKLPNQAASQRPSASLTMARGGQ